MFFIIEINNEKEKSSEISICDHFFGSIKDAVIFFENSIKDFIKNNYGTIVADSFSITPIDNLSNIIEPEHLGPYIYRLNEDPYTLYIYRKYQRSIPGWVWGKSMENIFEPYRIFKLKEYEKLSFSNFKSENKTLSLSNSDDFVSVGKGSMKIPKQMTSSPFADVLNSLKKSDKFTNRREKIEEHARKVAEYKNKVVKNKIEINNNNEE